MSVIAADVPDILGLPRHDKRSISPLELATRVEDGFPLSALQHLCRQIAPDDASFKYRIVRRATLARRHNARRPKLEPEESSRLVRLADIWSSALEIWKDETNARAFLFKPHPLLGGRSPIDFALGSEVGARLVVQILGRIRYGTES